MKNLWNLFRTNRSEQQSVEGDLCYLKPLVTQDAAALTKLLIDNKQFWGTHEPIHTASYYTEYTQYNKLVETNRLRAANKEHFMGIFDISTHQLIGQISLYGIKKLPFASCYIGYAIDEAYKGKGISTEAVKLIVQFAFEYVNVNRIEAYVSPKNTPSIRVLEKAGFKKEGLLKQLLYIKEIWEDHYLYAIVKSDFEQLAE